MGGLRVSLMPSGEGEDESSGLRRRLVILFAVLIFETIVVGGGFLFLANREATAMEEKQVLERRVAEITAKIRESEGDTQQMTLFDSRVRAVTQVLDEHIYWTSLFDYIRSVTKPSVNFTNFAGDSASGVVTLDAMASTYRDVAEQIVILRDQPMINEVITSSASSVISEMGEVQGVSFGLILKLDTEIWRLDEMVTESDLKTEPVEEEGVVAMEGDETEESAVESIITEPEDELDAEIDSVE
jgi:Tfp pilus assembly protein PilN